MRPARANWSLGLLFTNYIYFILGIVSSNVTRFSYSILTFIKKKFKLSKSIFNFSNSINEQRNMVDLDIYTS